MISIFFLVLFLCVFQIFYSERQLKVLFSGRGLLQRGEILGMNLLTFLSWTGLALLQGSVRTVDGCESVRWVLGMCSMKIILLLSKSKVHPGSANALGL